MTGLLHFTIAGESRSISAEWWDKLIGPKPEPGYSSNGCTASPDVWLGIALWPACVIHDWHYDPDGPDVHRLIADMTFRLNLWRIARLQRAPWWRAGYIAALYYSAVTVAGESHYKPDRAA